ncbi:putative small lipoprotein YifL [Actinoplanes lobatus]|nr:putative small lipoprotein YifL [Actinoplanes lobatus]
MTSVLAAVTLSLAACGSPQAATDGGSGPLKVGIVYSY